MPAKAVEWEDLRGEWAMATVYVITLNGDLSSGLCARVLVSQASSYTPIFGVSASTDCVRHNSLYGWILWFWVAPKSNIHRHRPIRKGCTWRLGEGHYSALTVLVFGRGLCARNMEKPSEVVWPFVVVGPSCSSAFIWMLYECSFGPDFTHVHDLSEQRSGEVFFYLWTSRDMFEIHISIVWLFMNIIKQLFSKLEIFSIDCMVK